MNNRMGELTLTLRRFWESILQKNITNFWDDADELTDGISKLDDAVHQFV
jgi:hypothetical protein